MEIDKLKFQNAYCEAINAKGNSFDLPNISDFDVVTSYETSGELENSINKLNRNISSLKEWIEVNLQETFSEWNAKISRMDPDDFDAYSDRDSVFTADLSDFTWIDLKDHKKNLEGKTIMEAYEFYITQEGSEANKICKELEIYIKDGYGNLEFVEIVQEENGFDLIVLKDQLGNPKIFNPGTHDYELNDVLFDFNKIFKKEFGPNFKKILDNLGPALKSNPISEVKEFRETLDSMFPGLKDYDYNIENYVASVYNEYVNQSHKYVDKYLEMAAQTGTKLYIDGYSLGGGMGEEEMLYAMRKAPLITKLPFQIAQTYVGNLTIVNSFHADMTDQEFDALLNSGKLKAYSIQSDMPSAVYDQDRFADYTTPIRINYEETINEVKAELIGSKPFEVGETVSYLIELFLDIDMPSSKALLTMKYFPAIISGGHSLDSIDPETAFDENGNAYNYYRLTGKYVPHEADKVYENPTPVYMEELPTDWGNYYYVPIEQISFEESSSLLFDGIDTVDQTRDTLASVESSILVGLSDRALELSNTYYHVSEAISTWNSDDNIFEKIGDTVYHGWNALANIVEVDWESWWAS